MDEQGWKLLGLQATPAFAAVLAAPTCIWAGLALWLAWLWAAVRALRSRYVP